MDIITIQNSINKIIQRFSQNPFHYFYEEDIRVDLGNDLVNNFKTVEFIHKNTIVNTSPIKFEYPSSFASKQRHDIVLLKKNSSNNIYNLDIPVAIELKLGSLSYDRCAKFKEDILKLLGGYSNKEFTGIAVYFYQDKIDPNLFKEWFIDTIENFEIINLNLFTLEESKVNSFIITPEYILKANNYKALIKI
ncbi:MAG: hypothetical protein BroJett005_08250 [Ignavibacteriota bacterium]|nr:MAG: hypothetical protein BroJett005_08250 [Ignavibacteriota bacterium]